MRERLPDAWPNPMTATDCMTLVEIALLWFALAFYLGFEFGLAVQRRRTKPSVPPASDCP
ncbi:MAG: hypothetical protein IAI48_00485 [Candidatus Eremiobacteraeota bacterium]|nr:hypothetical protein [Candidatus Eremiobacteraeota bacterium]